MILVNLVYYFAFGVGVPYMIDRLLMSGGYVLVGVAFIALYRDFGSYIPLLVTIMWPLLQVVGLSVAPVLGTPNLVNMSMYLITFLLMGYSVYLFREPIGAFATLASIIFIIWGFGQFVVKSLHLGVSDPTLDLVNWAGFALVFFIALVYFILAMRSESS